MENKILIRNLSIEDVQKLISNAFEGDESYVEDIVNDFLESDSDNVENPKHYQLKGLEPYQSIDIIKAVLTKEQWQGFCTGNALKYIIRYQNKNGVEDVEKARVYLNWLIDALKDEEE